jgi:hypothetical protein
MLSSRDSAAAFDVEASYCWPWGFPLRLMPLLGAPEVKHELLKRVTRPSNTLPLAKLALKPKLSALWRRNPTHTKLSPVRLCATFCATPRRRLAKFTSSCSPIGDSLFMRLHKLFARRNTTQKTPKIPILKSCTSASSVTPAEVFGPRPRFRAFNVAVYSAWWRAQWRNWESTEFAGVISVVGAKCPFARGTSANAEISFGISL